MDLPVHQPCAPDAPIPGRQWYSRCADTAYHVNADGVCEGCGEQACPTCGAGYYGPRKRGCQCTPEQAVMNAAVEAQRAMAEGADWAPTAAALAALEHGVDAKQVYDRMCQEVRSLLQQLERIGNEVA